MTIYDAGGNDTLDVSGFSKQQHIDLRPGHYSSVGGLTNNIAMAFNTKEIENAPAGDQSYDPNAVIENAVGGSDYDAILGNDVKNVLRGGAGHDALYGYGEDDVLDGGTGNDLMVGMEGDDTYFVDSARDNVSERWTGSDGEDKVISSIPHYELGDGVENLIIEGYSNGQWAGTGNVLSNTIYAQTIHWLGPNHQFTLDGAGGNDTLVGSLAADVFIGGDGDDQIDASDYASQFATCRPIALCSPTAGTMTPSPASRSAWMSST